MVTAATVVVAAATVVGGFMAAAAGRVGVVPMGLMLAVRLPKDDPALTACPTVILPPAATVTLGTNVAWDGRVLTTVVGIMLGITVTGFCGDTTRCGCAANSLTAV